MIDVTSIVDINDAALAAALAHDAFNCLVLGMLSNVGNVEDACQQAQFEINDDDMSNRGTSVGTGSKSENEFEELQETWTPMSFVISDVEYPELEETWSPMSFVMSDVEYPSESSNDAILVNGLEQVAHKRHVE